MSEGARVVVEIDRPIATVRLDRPARHNVLDGDGWRRLGEVFDEISENDDVRAVAVRGTGGRAFSAGSDIAAFEEQRSEPEDVRSYSGAIGHALNAIQGCRHPTVAIVEGLCVGGGLEIAACCDLRVCGESSRFGAPINRLGLTMSYDELEPLVRLLGPGTVLEILLSGELVDAKRALSVGLVNRVMPDGAVVEHGYGLVARIAAGAPLVNRWHKKFVRRLLDRRPIEAEEREEVHEAFETADYREGREAFLDKRKPDFSGE
ncbi:MAG: enoyl-CoA hydratase/isomerase family protein [Gemmatimonadetes bacterium]|nr:enoyl-CoA hydratase/isomerase family protein [Gemmatimonadota bacterium]NNF12371.1 enoyl-CoA hydratase/isomerase family protein [Gemmatimonadota bacterium]NNL30841.1 enoyl-CoA hydratase/isomerase family protein [Gemmatimonadota bacterium]